MIEPKIDDLLAAVDSKYTLVILAAKRAREINSYYNQLGEGRGEFVPPLVETGLRNKPLSIALEEIAEGKIDVRAHRGARGSSSPLAGRRVLLGVTGGIAAYKAAHLARLLTGRRRRRHGRHDRGGHAVRRPRHVRRAHRAPASHLAVGAPRRGPARPARARGRRRRRRAGHRQRARQARARPRRRPAHLHAPRVRRARSSSRRRCTPACGSTPPPRRTSQRSTTRGVRVRRPGRAARSRTATRAWAGWPSPRTIAGGASRGRASARGRRSRRAASVVVTAGPTHEPIDPVRFIGNRSSGKMGVAIAAEALARGADVTPVLGPGHRGRRRRASELVRVTTAEEMRAAVLEAARRRRRRRDGRRGRRLPPEGTPPTASSRRTSGPPELALEPTPDILAELGERERPAGPRRVRRRDRRRRGRGPREAARKAPGPARRERGRPRGHRLRRPTRTTPRSWPPTATTTRCGTGRKRELAPRRSATGSRRLLGPADGPTHGRLDSAAS